MAVSGTSTDYTGRTIDIYISTSDNLLISGATPVYYSFGNLRCQYIAGVQKLVQRYVISLMNSGFPEMLIGANSGNIQNASHLFNLYSWNVVSSFLVYQKLNPGLPDETLKTVQLLNVSVTNTQVSNTNSSTPVVPGVYANFNAQLLTAAGTTLPFILPLSVL